MNKYFTIYNAKGEILRAGSCPEEAVSLQADDTMGEFLLEQRSNPETDSVDVVAKQVVEGGRVLPPTKPGDSYTFDQATNSWVFSPELAWASVRVKRNKLLAATDWMVIKAMESGIALDPAWVDYRQALRDVTLQPDPLNIVWPTAPA